MLALLHTSSCRLPRPNRRPTAALLGSSLTGAYLPPLLIQHSKLISIRAQKRDLRSGTRTRVARNAMTCPREAHCAYRLAAELPRLVKPRRNKAISLTAEKDVHGGPAYAADANAQFARTAATHDDTYSTHTPNGKLALRLGEYVLGVQSLCSTGYPRRAHGHHVRMYTQGMVLQTSHSNPDANGLLASSTILYEHPVLCTIADTRRVRLGTQYINVTMLYKDGKARYKAYMPQCRRRNRAQSATSHGRLHTDLPRCPSHRPPSSQTLSIPPGIKHRTFLEVS